MSRMFQMKRNEYALQVMKKDQIINHFTWNSNHISSSNSALSKYFCELNTKVSKILPLPRMLFFKKVIYYEIVRVGFYKSYQVYRNFRVHSAIKIATLLLLDWKHFSIASRPKLLT